MSIDVTTMGKIMRALNQRPIAMYPIYILMTRRLTAAYMLSQIMYWFASSGQDRFFKTDAELMEEIYLSADEIRGAKRILKDLPWLKITREGVPPRTWYEIDWQGYVTHLSEVVNQHDIDEESQNQFRENPEIYAGKFPKSMPGSSRNITENTTEITTESSLARAREKNPKQSEEFPATAGKEKNHSARRPPHADELAGRRLGKAQQLWIEMEVPRHVAADRRPLLAEWLEYRSEIGRPVLSRHEMKELIQFFNKHGPGDLREMMAHSMRAGYPNLYPDSLNRQNKQQDVRSQKRGRPGRPDWSKYYPPS